eukprot:TRINITY_DN26063_c0_g2_i1.p1 TRINITY_DN26063_c0_g2~~TRINITY_DN26063_c0_g2_i1.p1  ORF type:complete len:104 (-),score=15.70 TRINITY_DN26063_c0_g2_i1:43-354(-)
MRKESMNRSIRPNQTFKQKASIKPKANGRVKKERQAVVRMSSAVKETRAVITIQRWFKSLLKRNKELDFSTGNYTPEANKSLSVNTSLVPSTCLLYTSDAADE